MDSGQANRADVHYRWPGRAEQKPLSLTFSTLCLDLTRAALSLLIVSTQGVLISGSFTRWENETILK